MPTGAVLLARTQSPLSESQLHRLRERFVAENHLDQEDFYPGGPLVVINNPDEGPMPIKDEGSVWLTSNIVTAYFGPGYERGDPKLLTRCAEWLERTVPGAEVWYGHDVGDENLRPFGPAESGRRC